MNFVTRDMIEPFLDGVVLRITSDVALFTALELSLAYTVKREANIDPMDDVADTPSWMLKPCAAIISKLCLPKIDAIQDIVIQRIEREYQEALTVLRANRVLGITTPPTYGTMEEGVISW